MSHLFKRWSFRKLFIEVRKDLSVDDIDPIRDKVSFPYLQSMLTRFKFSLSVERNAKKLHLEKDDCMHNVDSNDDHISILKGACQ